MTIARYVLVETATNLVVNMIEADESFEPEPGFIKILHETAAMGWIYDPLTETLSPPPPTVYEQLDLVYAAKYSEGVEVGSFVFVADDLLYFAPDYAQVASALNTTGSRVILSTNGWVSLSGAELLNTYDALLHLRSALTYAHKNTLADIDNLVITDWEEVEDAFMTYFNATPVLTATRITDELSNLDTAISDLTARVEALENGKFIQESPDVAVEAPGGA